MSEYDGATIIAEVGDSWLVETRGGHRKRISFTCDTCCRSLVAPAEDVAALREALRLVEQKTGACCCHANHDVIPACDFPELGISAPEIPAVPPSEHCCAFVNDKVAAALRAALLRATEGKD